MHTVPFKPSASVLAALALTCVLSGQTGVGSDLSRRDLIRFQIQALRPDLHPVRAGRLSRAIDDAVAQGCPVSWEILLGIAYVESSLNREAVGRLNPSTEDFGLMQINAVTARRLRLDRARLMRDEAYSLRAACTVLADNKARYADRHPYWLGLYRSGTRLDRPSVVRVAQAYDRKVRTLASRLGYRPTHTALAHR